MRIAEDFDADDGKLADVFQYFVVHRLVLNALALVANFHRAQHAAALGDAFKLLQHRPFKQLGQLVDDESALGWIFVFGQAPFAVDDELNCHGAAD